MTLDLREYSVAKIGSLWTEKDHQFLVSSLQRMEQTCIDVWTKIRNEARGEPRRLNELLTSVEKELTRDIQTFDLPFREHGFFTDP